MNHQKHRRLHCCAGELVNLHFVAFPREDLDPAAPALYPTNIVDKRIRLGSLQSLKIGRCFRMCSTRVCAGPTQGMPHGCCREPSRRPTFQDFFAVFFGSGGVRPVALEKLWKTGFSLSHESQCCGIV